MYRFIREIFLWRATNLFGESGDIMISSPVRHGGSDVDSSKKPWLFMFRGDCHAYSVAIAMHSCGDCHAFVWRTPRIQLANATRNCVDRHTCGGRRSFVWHSPTECVAFAIRMHGNRHTNAWQSPHCMRGNRHGTWIATVFLRNPHRFLHALPGRRSLYHPIRQTDLSPAKEIFHG